MHVHAYTTYSLMTFIIEPKHTSECEIKPTSAIKPFDGVSQSIFKKHMPDGVSVLREPLHNQPSTYPPTHFLPNVFALQAKCLALCSFNFPTSTHTAEKIYCGTRGGNQEPGTKQSQESNATIYWNCIPLTLSNALISASMF